ncbi:MAG: DNA-directed RNA polymerase subunit omega [Defluviitaleaceae bacterium]|nr:DNA-directed RNA polymerase subunit omega [Defluviitaleaceae bacterium]
MLQPSYSELMTILNETNEVDSKITSRYTIVIAAAKRARQLVETNELFPSDKPVSVAVNEMVDGKVKIVDESNGDGYYVALREMLQENKDDFMNDSF